MKIKLFVAREIQYFELGIFSCNSYVYYLTRGFIASTRAFNLLTRAFSLPTRAFNLATRAFSILTRGFELVTRAFELVTRVFSTPISDSVILLIHGIKENKDETSYGTVIEIANKDLETYIEERVISRIYCIHELIKLRPIIVKSATSKNRRKIEF